jgi:hypothetical protein
MDTAYVKNKGKWSVKNSRSDLMSRPTTVISLFSIWFPELQGGIACTPKCLSCSSNTRVSDHGYRNKTPARNVVCLTTNYFIMSRRYICHTCKASYKQAKNDAVSEPLRRYNMLSWGMIWKSYDHFHLDSNRSFLLFEPLCLGWFINHWPNATIVWQRSPSDSTLWSATWVSC